jgi:septal ring factor EnvC (AmiA/AmiB activator)
MTSISATTVNPYPLSAPKVSIRGAEEEKAVSPVTPTDSNEDKDKALEVDTSGANIAGAGGSSGASDVIEQLKKQIERTEKLLAEQQAQLARVQKSQADQEQKSQEAMAIQTQIMATQATLQTLQAALLQAMTVSIDTHA